MVIADHAADQVRRLGTVHRNDRQALLLEVGIERVIAGQGAGHDERVATTGFERQGEGLLRFGIVIGTRDQQLIPPCPGPLFQ